MTGWFGDFFRFWWALFYWNVRKTWFRLRGAHRDDCPCQNFGDSGHALDARCDAVIHWRQPARFRRVCPLLAETRDGWRCGVDAERVRPFWGRAAGYGAAAFLALYLTGSVAVFVFLRAARYDTGYLAVVWPPRWGELRGSQERLYATRARQALANGDYKDAILSLEMVCQLNPRNYPAGLALAGFNQMAGQPHVAEHIYERLMRDVPERRIETTRILLHSLLTRADYAKVKPLAARLLLEDPAQQGAWLHALLFAARQTRDSQFLASLLKGKSRLPDWCGELIGIEHLLLQGRVDQALPGLIRVHRPPEAAYLPYYQVDRLLRHGHGDRAGAMIEAYSQRLPRDEATFLRLRHFHSLGWRSLLEPEFENLLAFPLQPRTSAQACAYLINQPDTRLAAIYVDKFLQAGPAIDGETVGLYHATYLAAMVAGDQARADRVLTRITKFTSSDARVLRGLSELLRSGRPDIRLTRILPLIPLPTEVVYAILERQPVVAVP